MLFFFSFSLVFPVKYLLGNTIMYNSHVFGLMTNLDQQKKFVLEKKLAVMRIL